MERPPWGKSLRHSTPAARTLRPLTGDDAPSDLSSACSVLVRSHVRRSVWQSPEEILPAELGRLAFDTLRGAGALCREECVSREDSTEPSWRCPFGFRLARCSAREEDLNHVFVPRFTQKGSMTDRQEADLASSLCGASPPRKPSRSVGRGDTPVIRHPRRRSRGRAFCRHRIGRIP